MRILKMLVLLALLAVAFGGAGAQGGKAHVRFVHVIPGVAGLDVYVNDNLSAANLGYGESTGYIETGSGELTVRVTLSGVSSTLWQQPVNALSGDALTLIASSTDPLAFDAYDDSLGEAGLATSRVMIVHAINGGPALDVIAEGETIATALDYRGSLGTIDIPANTYNFTFIPEGGSAETPLLEPSVVSLIGRTSQFLVLYGPAASPATLLLEAPVELTADAGFLRVAHGAEGAPNIDVLLDDSLVVPGLSFGQSTVHIPVEPGTYTATLRVAGGGSEIATAEVEVVAGEAQTLAAIGTLDDLQVTAFADDLTAVEPRTAVVSLINGITGATVSLVTTDGDEIATSVAFGSASPAVALEPSRTALTLTVNAGEVEASVDVPVTSFYGGVYYNLIAVRDGGTFALDIEPTSLEQAINSAPGATATVIVEVQPTATTEAPAATSVAEATPIPQATAIPSAPTVPTFPTARVVLDPGANLHLREYPRADARSLGLTPNGTVFNVNGRAGAPIDPITGEELLLPDETEFVDPVTLLEDERTDLPAQDTWLNVTLTTPDGSVTAWINALFVDVRTPRGERQLLRDLPTVPQNQPGESTGNIVSTPAPPENVARAIVFNLDPGVGLNIRRTPESSGEVLARLLNDDSVVLIGFGESGDWAFVELTTPEGGTVRGWAGTLYLRYEFRGRAVNIEEMTTLNLLQEVDEETLRGSVTAGVAPVTPPTQDPMRNVNVATVVGLDPGINLNMRRTPDTDAEVIAQIPNGMQVVVLSRSGSEAWLEVEFEGQTGWVASLYTSITFNGVPVAIADIPVSETFSATSTPTPTPEPTATETPAP